MSHARSQEAFQSAQILMPGGVNSPARACRSVGAEPVFIASASILAQAQMLRAALPSMTSLIALGTET